MAIEENDTDVAKYKVKVSKLNSDIACKDGEIEHLKVTLKKDTTEEKLQQMEEQVLLLKNEKQTFVEKFKTHIGQYEVLKEELKKMRENKVKAEEMEEKFAAAAAIGRSNEIGL